MRHGLGLASVKSDTLPSLVREKRCWGKLGKDSLSRAQVDEIRESD